MKQTFEIKKENTQINSTPFAGGGGDSDADDGDSIRILFQRMYSPFSSDFAYFLIKYTNS